MFPIIEKKRFDDGERIFSEGDPGSEVFRVLSGAVVITKEVGGRSLILEVLRTGEIFGEMAFLAESTRTASASALGSTVIGTVDLQSLVGELDSVSQGLYQLFECLALRLKKTTDAAAGINLVRKEPRASVTWPVDCEKKDRTLTAATHNASLAGLFIQCPEPFSRGERFKAVLTLPKEKKPLEIPCEVVWNREETTDPEEMPKGMGVRFLGLERNVHEKLKKALKP